MANYKDKTFFRSTLGKIIAAFLIGGIAIFLSWGVTRIAFREMLQTVGKISAPNEKLRIVNNLFHEITRLDRLHAAESLKKGDKEYNYYLQESQDLLKTIDTLRFLSNENYIQVARLDSMKTILNTRNKLLLDYLNLRAELIHNESLSKDLRSLSKLIINNTPKVDSSIKTTAKKVVTTTTIVEDKDDNEEPKKNPGFLGKLFGKRKNEKENTDTKKVVTEELNITIDTLATASKDTIMKKVALAMRTIEKTQRAKGEVFLRRELELIKTENMLVNQLLSILHEIESEEVSLVKMDNENIARLAESSLVRINVIMIVFFMLAAFLLFLIFADIARTNKYRKELIAAKEEAERLGMVKQRFLSNMSHEIRTPLQSILGFAELSRQQEKPQKEYMDAIYHSSEYLLQIVNEVLDYSRIVSGKFTMEQHSFNMLQLIKEVADPIHLQASKKQINFLLDVDMPEASNYLGDPFRLKQILFNLLGNAVKFTDEGSVTLGVKCTQQADKVKFAFEVTDTGIGIPEEDLQRIFNQFEQSNASIARLFGGTGLGLSIVKSLVESQGGEISVSSKAGQGSCFTVELTYQISHATTSPESPETLTQTPGSVGKVIVVDDDALILQLCSAILTKNKIDHSCFSSPDALLSNDMDLACQNVFLDIRLPGMSGVELCKKLREQIGDQVKIYALTAQVLPDERDQLLKQGFNGLLLKPFREKELMGVIGSGIISELVSVTEIQTEKEIEEEFDLTTIVKMTGDDPELIKVILEGFIEDTQQDILHIFQYIEKNDPVQVRELVHRLAGRCGQMGARDVAAVLREVEVTLHEQKDLTVVGEELNNCIVSIKVLIKAVKSKLAEPKSTKEPI